MLISERLWIMSLDNRGLPRTSSARVAVTAGLMLDLEAAGLVVWSQGRITRTQSSATPGLLGWAARRLDAVREATEARFTIDMLFPGAWEQVGMELAEQGLVRIQRTKLRRRPRFSTVATPLRREVVEASRTLLFDYEPHDDDACLAVVGATGGGGELLALTPFTDEAVASAFADRGPGALETKVDAAIAYALVPFWANGYSATGGMHTG